MNAKLFINYRRDDTGHAAGRLYDRLIAHFGEDQVFIDIDQIEPGEDFVEVINRKVGACDIALVAIGPNWLRPIDASGKRRLDDEEDFVRMEIVAALQRNIRVVPVLVGGARMPGRQDLPEALASLSRRNAIELSETRFHADVNRLIEAIEKSFSVREEREPPATPPALPQDPAAARAPEPESKDLAEPSKSAERAEPKPPAVKSSSRVSAQKLRRPLPLVVGALGLLAIATLLVSIIVLNNQVQPDRKSGKLPSSSESHQKSNAITKPSPLETVLVGHRWEARLADRLLPMDLSVVFMIDGTFEGTLKTPRNGIGIKPQRVSGKWQVASQILALTYTYIHDQGGLTRAEYRIRITEVSERSVSGVDAIWGHDSWEFKRLD
jgi:TIR domain-containing protein